MNIEDLGDITLETLPGILDKLDARQTLMQQTGRFKWSVVIWGANWKNTKRPLSDLRTGQGEGTSPTAAIRNALKAFLEYKPYVPKGTIRIEGAEELKLPKLTLDLKDLK